MSLETQDRLGFVIECVGVGPFTSISSWLVPIHSDTLPTPLRPLETELEDRSLHFIRPIFFFRSGKLGRALLLARHDSALARIGFSVRLASWERTDVGTAAASGSQGQRDRHQQAHSRGGHC